MKFTFALQPDNGCPICRQDKSLQINPLFNAEMGTKLNCMFVQVNPRFSESARYDNNHHCFTKMVLSEQVYLRVTYYWMVSTVAMLWCILGMRHLWNVCAYFMCNIWLLLPGLNVYLKNTELIYSS